MYNVFVSLLLTAQLVLGLPVLNHEESPLSFWVADQARGILSVAFDPSKNVSSSLSIVHTAKAGNMPGWLTAHNKTIYSVSRNGYPNNQSLDGGVFAFQRPKNDSILNPLVEIDSVDSNGASGVACDVSRDGRTLGVADIDGSTVSVHPILDNGGVGNASYIFKYNLAHPGPGAGGSQNQSNPHEAVFDPSGQFMFVPDRGADLLYVYKVNGPHDVAEIQRITLPPGTGPRHLTFRPFNCTRTFMYLVSELDNYLRVYTVDGVSNLPVCGNPKNLTIELRQGISTLGLGTNRTPPNNTHLASEVAISNDGRYAYVSNRETTSLVSDDLAIFSLNVRDQIPLTFLGRNATYGKIPRHFALSKDQDNKYIAVGNEVTQSVMVLERDPKSGFVKALRGNLTLGGLDVTQNSGPTCILWN